MRRIEILHEIRQDQRAAPLIEYLHFRKHRCGHGDGLKLRSPFSRGEIAEFAVDAKLGRSHLFPGRKPPRREGLSLRQLLLPVGQKHPVRNIGREQISDRAQTFELAAEKRRIPHRRVQYEIAIRQPDDRHANRQDQTRSTDGRIVSDPDVVGHPREAGGRRGSVKLVHERIPVRTLLKSPA